MDVIIVIKCMELESINVSYGNYISMKKNTIKNIWFI